MNMPSSSKLTQKIVEKAKSLGASVAGIAKVDDLKESPSHLITHWMGKIWCNATTLNIYQVQYVLNGMSIIGRKFILTTKKADSTFRILKTFWPLYTNSVR